MAVNDGLETVLKDILEYQELVLKKEVAEISILYGINQEKGGIWNIWIARQGSIVKVVGQSISECLVKLREQGEYDGPTRSS